MYRFWLFLSSLLYACIYIRRDTTTGIATLSARLLFKPKPNHKQLVNLLLFTTSLWAGLGAAQACWKYAQLDKTSSFISAGVSQNEKHLLTLAVSN